MSLITSAKSVKLGLNPSLSAHVFALAVLLALIWAVILSPIPLVATLYLCSKLLGYPIQLLLPQQLQGEVDIHFDGSIRVNNQNAGFQSVTDFYGFAFLIFNGDKRRWMLWRDSVDEVTYRQLLVRLKQEH